MYLKFKRGMDVFLALIGLILTAPLMLIMAIAIKIDSPGPILFRQKRVGPNESYFTILKFRTMQVDAPRDVPTHRMKHPERYITRVGGFLRRKSLDELPQMINILRGEMSLVGPRPALWNEFDLLEAREKWGANDICPGLTGWAQINGRDRLKVSEKAKYDGEYTAAIKHGRGFFMDCRCFFGTFFSVFQGDVRE